VSSPHGGGAGTHPAPHATPVFSTGFLGVLILLFPSPVTSQAGPCPRAALARLAELAGRWSVEWSYLLEGQLRTVDKAAATIDLAAGGCAVSERLEGELRGRPLAIHTLIAAPSDTTLQRVYIDSEHGTLLEFAGTITGDTIRFVWLRDLGTRRQVVRHEYTAITRASFATETCMSPNGGTDWIVVQRARYRRRPQ